MCSEAVESTYDDLGEQLRFQKNLLIDESPTKEARHKAWVWTMVAKTFTYFACRTTRSGEILTQLLGKFFKGVINCDRAKMYLQFQLLQWCWAHLKRDFESWAASPCPTKKRLGQDLLRQTKLMFEWMKKYRDKKVSRAEWLQRMAPIREEINDLLFRGKCNGLTRSITLPIWKRREDLWRFIEVKDVEPTNNAAERSLRHAVIWRKLSFGTQSAGGSRFVERMLTVIETARQRKINAFEWLTQAIQAKLNKQPCPKLQPGV
jgi:transposase